MTRKATKLFALIAILALVAALAGCAATYTGIRYKDLQVQNKMSASIFLEPVPPEQRTVFIQVRNTSDKPFDLQQDVAAMVAAKGYQIVQDPNKAHYWLQANVLQVGEMDASALEAAGMAGFGGPIAGAAAGALIAGSGHRTEGAIVGGLVAGAAELVAGAAVKVNTFAVITDLQISEKSVGAAVSEQFDSKLRQGTGQTYVKQSTAKATQYKKYQTRIMSSARQTNLTFEEAYPALRQGIAQSIAGIL